MAYLIDSEGGLFAHSPIYLLALPGYWLLAKVRSDVAYLCVLVFLSLLLPSAAHTLSGATPNRLIVSVVPFAAIPIAAVAARYAYSRVFQAAFVMLLILSAQNAWAYNWAHLKHVYPMVDRSFSGWKVNLLFPDESRTPWEVSNANGWLLVAWIAVLAGLLLGPMLTDRFRLREWSLPAFAWARESAARMMFVLALMIVALGTTLAAVTGRWDKAAFRMRASSTARDAAGLVGGMGGCALCISSAGGRLTTDQTFSRLVVIAPSLAAGAGAVRRDYDEWLQMPERIRTWYIEAYGHEPSGADIGHYLFQWREERARPEEIRRRIFSTAKKPLPKS